jgi:hypothetical protein
VPASLPLPLLLPLEGTAGKQPAARAHPRTIVIVFAKRIAEHAQQAVDHLGEPPTTR